MVRSRRATANGAAYCHYLTPSFPETNYPMCFSHLEETYCLKVNTGAGVEVRAIEANHRNNFKKMEPSPTFPASMDLQPNPFELGPSYEMQSFLPEARADNPNAPFPSDFPETNYPAEQPYPQFEQQYFEQFSNDSRSESESKPRETAPGGLGSSSTYI